MFHANGEMKLAATELRKLLRKYPRDVQGLTLSGLLECARGDFSSGCEILSRAARLAPENTEVLLHYGTALGDADRHEESLAVLTKLEKLSPGDPVTHYLIGNALMGQLRTGEAADAYARAKALDPAYREAHWNHAVAQLTLGRFDVGWTEAESRRRLEDHSSIRSYPENLFLTPGVSLEGLPLLLYAEQGLGDTLQFARYASDFADRGAQVRLEVQPPLRTLLSTMDPRVEVIATGEPFAPFAAALPLMSSPWALGEGGPRQTTTPYLQASPERVHIWKERLGPRDRPLIGVAWQGSLSHGNDRRRSMDKAVFEGLFDPAFAWLVLGKDFNEADRRWLATHGVSAHDEALTDFAETAALVANLDLIITVDTSVAHLSGALGRPTWILLAHSPDWRWMLGRDDSPWYPDVRLFRQTERGDWAGVIGRVRAALSDNLG